MKRIQKKSQRGFGVAVIIAGVGVVALLGVLGYLAFTAMNKDASEKDESANTSQQSSDSKSEEKKDTASSDKEELKGVSIGMTRAEVEAVYGQPTSKCMDYPDGSVGCAYSKDELIGAGNGFEVAYKDGAVFAATFTDNSANTMQQLTKDGVK